MTKLKINTKYFSMIPESTLDYLYAERGRKLLRSLLVQDDQSDDCACIIEKYDIQERVVILREGRKVEVLENYGSYLPLPISKVSFIELDIEKVFLTARQFASDKKKSRSSLRYYLVSSFLGFSKTRYRRSAHCSK